MMGRPAKLAPGIGERLAELRGDMNRDELAEVLGVHPNSIANYERGDRKTDVEFLQLIGDRLDTDLNWLITGRARSVKRTGVGDSIAIPRYEIQASAGNGSVVLSEEVADYFNVSRDWIARFAPSGARLGMIEARGDSMEPTIRDGDALVISFDVDERSVAAGGVFVVGISGNLLVKRLQLMSDGSVRVSSDNRNYQPEVLTSQEADDRLTINARVLFAVAPLR